MKETIYFKQAELLLRILPYIEAENVFALKGDTAINFFVRELPRLSVDIDLAYIPVSNRDDALTDISRALKNISLKVKRIFSGCQVSLIKLKDSDFLRKIIISANDVTVKIEPNLIMRGTVYDPEVMELSQNAQNSFEMSVSVKALSFSELYASKICATLDRQHPRDLFDMHMLLKNEGIDKRMHKAFIVYLICHSRPIVELLNPNFLDIKPIFENDFVGMTTVNISLEDLLDTRKTLVSSIRESLTNEERKFLISVKKGKPEWNLLGLTGIEDLPAVKWKLMNIKKMDKKKHKEALEKLRNYLEK